MEEMSQENTNVGSGKKIATFTDKVRENPWVMATLVLGVLSLVLIIANFSSITGGVITGAVISDVDAGNKLLTFFESQGAEGLSIASIEKTSGIYKVIFNYQGAQIPYYVTLDGNLAGSLTELTVPTTQTASSSTKEIPKSDKPIVELFVMTYCPYGTQAEKGLIPLLEKAGGLFNAKIRFVHYFMHGDQEESETKTQVCIREEQKDKFLPYLKFFLEEGDSDYALKMAGVDLTKLNTCIDSGMADKYYAEDSALSEEYGVGGSPTLVVNGQIVSSGRSPAAYFDTICQAFNDDKVPEECGYLDLDDTTPAPMWGWDASASSGSTASCG